MHGEPEIVRVWLLGGFRVSVGDRSVREGGWRLKKAASLVKLLALAPGHRLHREQAMDLLWPEQGRRAAANNLRGALHAARKVIDPAVGPRYLASEDESLVLCPGGDLWVDVDAFDEAARTARRSREPTAYEAALDLYAGELLPADRYEEWAEEHRRRLRETYLSLLVGLARLHEERADYGSAADALRRVATEEPSRAEAHADLMRVYALMGNKGEALAQYGRLEEVFLRELGTEPPAYSRALREEISAGRFPPEAASSLASSAEEQSSGRKHNLPAARTSFVGREREMVELKRTLAMTRLLTLTGAGGSGKTRLALEVSRDLIGIYPDGAWLVELAPLSEGDLVAQEVAGALKVAEHPAEPLTDTLAEALADKEMLLIMDNCEHLVGAAAQLVDALLDSCPRLRVLATSRAPLGLSGEVLWQVRSLSLPDVDGEPTPERLMRYEALRLFVERARLRLPDFGLGEDNAGAVTRVCRKLEGIPLAIELAAARIGTLDLDQINEMLEDSLGFLTGGGRTAVPRQRTLRGTLDWSHELLGERERVLFRRLSVFAGGWTLDAAKALASDEDVEQNDVVDLLSGLVDKSLVVVEASGDGGVRYRLLEPVRQYAREKLEESEEAQTTLRRHAEYLLALVQEAEPQSLGPEEVPWLDRLEMEHENFRAALSSTLEQGAKETSLQLAGALAWFWETRGHVGEGARWLEEALGKADQASSPAARAGALLGWGRMLLYHSDFSRAEACFAEALGLYEGLGDRARVAEALANLGWAAEYQGDATRAKVLFEEGLAAARESENRRILHIILDGLGWTASDTGDFERAEALWKEALVLEKQSGSNMGASGVLFNLGYTKLARGDHEQATALLEESLTIGRQMGDKGISATALVGLGIAATLRGEPNEATTLLKEALTIEVEMENKMDMAETIEALAEAAGVSGQHLRAARLWGAAEALRKDTGFTWVAAERLLHEPQLATARSRLDKTSWDAAFAEGKAMSLEEAVEYALSEGNYAALHAHAEQDSPANESPPALTRREREVASLVAQGLTNRQIASELFISERTVDHHVEKVLKKLELSSRDQVVSRLAE